MHVRFKRLRFLQGLTEKNITENSFSTNYTNLKSTYDTNDADDNFKTFNEIRHTNIKKLKLHPGNEYNIYQRIVWLNDKFS